MVKYVELKRIILYNTQVFVDYIHTVHKMIHKKDNIGEVRMKKRLKIILIILVIIVMALLGIVYLIKINNNSERETYSYTNITEKQNYVENVTHVILDGNIPNTTMNIIDYEEQVKRRTIDKVSMTIKEGTLTKKGATLIIIDNNDIPYEYGKSFIINVKENEEWKILEQENDAIFTLEGYYARDGKLQMQTDWSEIYGELKKGEYRIGKELYIDGEYKYIWAEFTIE